MEGKFSAVGDVKTTVNPPNEGVIGRIYELIDNKRIDNKSGEPEGLKQKVLQAWEFLYKRQADKNPLPKVLDKQFVTDFQQLAQRPFVDKPETELDDLDRLPELDREQYQREIQRYVSPETVTVEERHGGEKHLKGEVPKHHDYLFEKLDLRRPKGEPGGGHAGANPGQPHGHSRRPIGPGMPPHNPGGDKSAEMVGVLEWNQGDPDRITSQFHWEEVPDTLTIRLAQEDLWVYEALLRIIENTNAGTTYENAAIRQVEALEIGKQAAQSWKQNESPLMQGVKPAGGGPGTPRGAGRPRPGPRPGRLGATGSGQQESQLSDRYVDDKGYPLADGTKHPYAEFKMMPIDIRLVIHQRKVTKLLAECANSNMPIVVRSVAIRPGEGQFAGAAAGPAPAPGGGRHWSGGGGGQGNAEENAASESSGSPYLPIEVRGIIYIYNPPTLKNLGKGSSGGAPPRRRRSAGRPSGKERLAMKAKFKLKLNKESIQRFFLDNGEKLVFGLVALGGLLMISQALTRKNYEKKPEELMSSSEEANQKIDRTPPDAIPPECHSAEFEKLVRRIELTVEPLAYDYRNPWDNPVVKPLKLRPQPQLFAALELRGVAGAAKFKVRTTGTPSERITLDAVGKRADIRQDLGGRRYAVLTALVPVEQQTAAYQDTFDGVGLVQELDDAPFYHNFVVQRAVVHPGGQSQDLEWEPEEDATPMMRAAIANWQGAAAEVADPKFIWSRGNQGAQAATPRGARPGAAEINPLVFPLGPLVGRSWGQEAVHDPEIPLFKVAKGPAAPLPARVETPPDDDAAPTVKTPAPATDDEEPKPKYALLRYFDFNAEPGKTYRYRVALRVINPNYKVEAGYLANPDYAAGHYLQGPWSEPSNEIAIPEDTRALVRSVQPAKSSAVEVEATLAMLLWQEASGTLVHKDFTNLPRGKVLNFVNEVLEPPRVSPPPPPPPPHTRRPKPHATFITDAVLVDVAGDKDYGEMLLLDKDGNLVARNTVADGRTYDKWLADEKQLGEGPAVAPGPGPGPRPPTRPPDLGNFGTGGRQPHGGR